MYARESARDREVPLRCGAADTGPRDARSGVVERRVKGIKEILTTTVFERSAIIDDWRQDIDVYDIHQYCMRTIAARQHSGDGFDRNLAKMEV